MAAAGVVVGKAAVVCQDAVLKGTVTVGEGCVLHPRCVVDGTRAPVVLGAGNVVEENARIVATGDEPLSIGKNNMFAVGCGTARKRGKHNDIVWTLTLEGGVPPCFCSH